jgi:hypothetical protein
VRRRDLALSALVLALVAGATTLAQPSSGQITSLSSDRRLKPLKDLDGEFLFSPFTSSEAWKARTNNLRRQLQVALGLWPMPEATPLNAVVHGAVTREGYTVEKVYFESLPGHFVTGSLYRPTGRQGRLPAVLLPHGHWQGGRFYETPDAEFKHELVTGAERFDPSGRFPLQAAPAQLARMGVIAFIFDLEGYADSVQIPSAVAHGSKGRPKDSPAAPGLFFHAQTDSRLQSIMGLQSWNARRALDFLISLPDVDASRIGVSGASGGGTQTFILGALDPRPSVFFPMVMVGTRMQGGCTCENADYLRIGTGNVEIASLMATRPVGMTTADDWTKTMPETGFGAMQAMWKMLGAPDRVAIFPMPQFEHNYNYVSRGAMYGWMNKYLGLGQAEPIVAPEFVPLTREEASVWDAAHPKPASGEAEERRVTSWWTGVADRQMADLRPHDAASLDRYREVVGGALAVMVSRGVPGAEDVVAELGSATTSGSVSVRRGVLRQARWGEITPVVQLQPAHPNGSVVVWLDEKGTAAVVGADGGPAGAVASLLQAGATVLGIDVFGTGESAAAGAPAKNRLVEGTPFAPYTYGYNSPLIIQRTHDVLAALSYARLLATDTPVAAGSKPRVSLLGLGATAGTWAALARAAAPSLVDRAAIDTGGFRFASVGAIDDAAFLPGGAKYDDVPGFLAVAAPSPLWLAGEGPKSPAVVAAAYGATGAARALTVSPLRGPQATANAIKWLTTAN